jgi:hypothetical protein
VLYCLTPGSAEVRVAAAWGFAALGLAAAAALFVRRTRRFAGISFALALVPVLAIWGRATPSNDRDWQPEPEEVYLFHLIGPIENGRRLFLDYMRDINELRGYPRFYNTLTTNCTTMILTHAAVNPGHLTYSWKVLASGYAPEYAYENGRLDRSLPFEELKERAHINAAARAADRAPDFSQRIRAGLP